MNEDILHEVAMDYSPSEVVSIESFVSKYNERTDNTISKEDFIDCMNEHDYSTGTDFYSETEDLISELVERDNLASAKAGIDMLLDSEYSEDNLYVNWDGTASEAECVCYGDLPWNY